MLQTIAYGHWSHSGSLRLDPYNDGRIRLLMGSEKNKGCGSLNDWRPGISTIPINDQILPPLCGACIEIWPLGTRRLRGECMG